MIDRKACRRPVVDDLSEFDRQLEFVFGRSCELWVRGLSLLKVRCGNIGGQPGSIVRCRRLPYLFPVADDPGARIIKSGRSTPSVISSGNFTVAQGG